MPHPVFEKCNSDTKRLVLSQLLKLNSTDHPAFWDMIAEYFIVETEWLEYEKQEECERDVFLKETEDALKEFSDKIMKNMEDLPREFAQVIDNNFEEFLLK